MEALWYSPLFWGLAIAGVILTGISKSGFAGGAGVMAVPLLALVMPVPAAAALMLPLLIVMDAKTVHYYWRSASKSELLHIVPAALLGIGLGGWLMGSLSSDWLQRILGIFCVLFACWQPLASILGRIPGGGWLWGAVSGVSSTLLHAGGPPINIYLVARALPKPLWLATASLFFAVMNLVKVIPYGLLGQWKSELLLMAALLLPAALVGVWLGHRIQRRINERQFMQCCRVLLLLSGISLLVKGFI
ncbi:sulfite exporter TauE/SafE family protein [Porticoccaceae bacterium LTM1]|nr:sulfite exporter TauE/SafE family protein [Porticoccaceae bacterium LTM1]